MTELEEVEWSAGPGWSTPPAVGDRPRWERYEILEGRVRVVVADSSRVYCAGESVIVGDQPPALEPVDGYGVRLRVQRWVSDAAPQEA